ncbi:Long chain fatty acyl CoA synthetase [Trichostrongylus colubriformis]|uniref:Long-chain-fatty-acid--CoA ligase n=1 Tax=Trichostrongylus colubriformis TaxID=6319 RepID=A0AAN8INC8_TRICO
MHLTVLQRQGNAFPSCDRIGIYAQNREEWLITALGCIQQSIIIVPLYDTLGADAASFVVSQAEISVIVVDSLLKAQNLASKKSLMPTLRDMVMMDRDGVTDEFIHEMKEAGIRIIFMKEVIERGWQNPQPRHLPTKEDIYIICYTSGTTGTPKGVIITHANIVANISGWIYVLKKFIPEVLTPDLVLISYLPLSHMMEQMSHWSNFIYGASIGYFSGSIPRLLDDINALRPTAFPVVPRLLNRFYDALQSKVQNGGIIARLVYKVAYSKKLALLKQGITTRDSIWDKLVFSKVQAQIGGRVNTMATGSAPISAEVLETCRIAMGATIVEGYGQTECTAMATMTWPGDWTGGHCGGVAPCCNIKLLDVPELNYYAKDGKGEIMIRGPSVTKGYYKDPEKTAELFDEQGFLHTGDIGEMLPSGAIRIIDRKKHIFKLAQGEYVAPEKIENVYIRSLVVQQIFVDGNSLERYLIAIVVPEPKVMEDWNAEHGVPGRTLEQICSDKKAHEYVLSQLHQIGKENKLNSIEQVKRIYLEMEPFSVENGLLTPTLKAKRPQLRLKYKDIIDRIYRENKNV